MELKMIYDLLVIKSKQLMEMGDVTGYLRTLSRINELKMQIALN
jgi:hypothetical protein